MLQRRQRQQTNPREGIARFWNWWSAGGAERATTASGNGRGEATSVELAAMVSAIHPGLQWEVTAGRGKPLALCVSGGGQPELRTTAERWARAAPADDRWEYRSARLADPDALSANLRLGPYEVTVGDATCLVAVDSARHVLDVTLHQPAFPRMVEQARLQVAHLMLAWLLGEDNVERWLGRVEVSVTDPPASMPIAELPDLVHSLADRPVEPSWTSWEAIAGSYVVVVAARRPLKRVDHPLLDLHLAVTLRYGDRTEHGLPTDSASLQLHRLQDSLLSRLGTQALLIGHETGGGSRVLHLYGDSEVSATAERTWEWAAGVTGASVTTRLDLGWREAARFL
jgi:hypothetical protein